MRRTLLLLSTMAFALLLAVAQALAATTVFETSADKDCDGIADSSDTEDNRYGVLSSNTAEQNRRAFVGAVNTDKNLYVCGGDTQASDNFDIGNSWAINTTGASGSVHMENGAYFDLTTNLMGFRFINAAQMELYNWRVLGTDDGTSNAAKTNTVFRDGSDVLVDGTTAAATSMDGISSPASSGEINGSSGVGLVFYHTIRPTVKNMRFINTGRDALHYATTQDAVAENVFTLHSGDDGVAFLNDEADVDRSGFRATNIEVVDSYSARGITVVGQRDGVIDGFRIDTTRASALYVVEEDGVYQTREPANVTVKNGCINNAGQVPGGPHRHAIGYNSLGSNVRFENIQAYHHAGRLIANLSASSEGRREAPTVVNVTDVASVC
jgi:hypothetical protein